MPNLFLLSAYSIIWEMAVLVPRFFPAGQGLFSLFFKDFPISSGYAPVGTLIRQQILFSVIYGHWEDDFGSCGGFDPGTIRTFRP